MLTKDELKDKCKKCGIDITQCLNDIDAINSSISYNTKNKHIITRLINDVENLIKTKGILDETSN